MYVDLRRSKGYIDQLERLTRDESKITLNTTVTDAYTKK